jgi:hypothetical protein
MRPSCWCRWWSAMMTSDDDAALCWWRGAYLGRVSRLVLAKMIRHGGGVRSKKSATAHERVPWGAAWSLLGTVIAGDFSEMSQRRGWSRGAWWQHDEQTIWWLKKKRKRNRSETKFAKLQN